MYIYIYVVINQNKPLCFLKIWPLNLKYLNCKLVWFLFTCKIDRNQTGSKNWCLASLHHHSKMNSLKVVLIFQAMSSLLYAIAHNYIINFVK